jgi:hypothetical protein
MSRVPDEHNNNPAYRPTNAQLFRWSVYHCIGSAVIGVLIGAFGYAYLTRAFGYVPVGGLSISYGVLGAIIALTIFFPTTQARGRKMRALYRAGGGDDTGMTNWMLAAMGGHLDSEGKWEWYHPTGSGGDYV